MYIVIKMLQRTLGKSALVKRSQSVVFTKRKSYARSVSYEQLNFLL